MPDDFDRLVDNAIDFLQHSVKEVKTDPKYSLIHFYSAVELFLKSRLLKEHWTLVVARQKDLDRENFEKGDFVSVSLADAQTRLQRVLGSGLEQEVYKAFDEVRTHRNKLVHFFHNEQGSDEFEKIVKQELRAWYYLNNLLTRKWKTLFTNWNSAIATLGEELRTIRQYLSVIYDETKPKIEEFRRAGYLILDCPSCGYEAEKHEDKQDSPYETECLVCGFTELCMRSECPECGETILFRSEGNGSCSSCGEDYEPESVAEALHSGGFSETVEAVCNCECGSWHTVFLSREGKYICTQCFSIYDEVEQCEWCYERYWLCIVCWDVFFCICCSVL